MEVDDTLVPTYVDGQCEFGALTSPVKSISMTVQGASAGNGTFTSSDFASYRLTKMGKMNLDLPWVGQLMFGGPWGIIAGDFGPQSFPSAGAPSAAIPFAMLTANGGGSPVRLKEFNPMRDSLAVGDVLGIWRKRRFLLCIRENLLPTELFMHGPN